MRTPCHALAACAVLVLFDCGPGTQAVAKAKFIEFDPPGSVTTLVFTRSLNEKGDVTGTYFKKDGARQRAFIRKKNGDFIVIAKDLPDPQPTAINIHDATTGQDRQRKGFITAKDGTAITFRVPGTDDTGIGTKPRDIDDDGNVAGYYSNPGQTNAHGFLRKKNGHFKTFDAPNAGTQKDQGTFVTDLNSSGYIAGWFVDGNNVSHGFLRAPDGDMTIIDVSDAGTGPDQGTHVIGLNDNGALAGWFVNPKNRIHGFLREADGNVIPITVQNDGNDPGQGTSALAINNSNVVTGDYEDADNAYHGFVRSVTGKIKKFDAPDAVFGVSMGTSVGGINDDGEISGMYNAAPGGYEHGFLRKP